MYYHGYGIEQDYKVAFNCYQKAAELGNLDALKNVFYLYLDVSNVFCRRRC